MSTANRHTLFLDDAVSDGKLDFVVAKPTPPISRPPTDRTLKRRRVIGRETQEDEGSTEPKPVSSSSSSTRSRFPIKHGDHSSHIPLVPVLTGSPWSHYERRYGVKYGNSFSIITSRRLLNRSDRSDLTHVRSDIGSRARRQIRRDLTRSDEGFVRSGAIGYPIIQWDRTVRSTASIDW
ncbi:hypothetical protein F4824DRAFT_299488 [Ustulina deusta]|nr:hypothetical protein F4824DRAFT_299488 [Ustulina deusta]